MKNTNILHYIFMHVGFLLYAFYPVLGKLASKYDFLSPYFCALYCGIIFLLFIYALLWQQVLKTVKLPVAMCNKAVTIVWGMLLSRMIFTEEITPKKVLGAVIILCGIVLLSAAENTGKKGGKV